MLKLLRVFHKYPTYFVVGSFVTFITIILRDILGRLFSLYWFGYVLSIVAVYPIGIGLSYVLQSRFTFQIKKYHSRENLSRIYFFIATHLLGLILTIFLSIVFRNLMKLSLLNISSLQIISQDSLAYITAIFITSIITYIINKKVTFISNINIKSDCCKSFFEITPFGFKYFLITFYAYITFRKNNCSKSKTDL